MRLLLVTLFSAFWLVAIAGAPALADPSCSDVVDLGGAARTCAYSGSDTLGLFANSGSNGDGHTYAVRPQCGDESNGQAICQQTAVCTADDGELGTLMNLYRDGVLYGETCLSDAQAETLGVVTPGLVLREFRRLAWPQSPLTIEPPGQRTAVNLPTYFLTDNVEPTTQAVRIIGQDVEIEATPTSYVYRFGEGESLETTSPGAPYPDGDVTHEYRRKGTVRPAVDTVYSGRYRVNGGPWREIDETVTVAGTPVALQVVEVRPTLVAPANP